MRDRDVVDLVVVDFGIPVRQYISEPDDVSGMGNFVRDCRSGLVEVVHGSPHTSKTRSTAA